MFDQVYRILNDRQGTKSQKIHFQKSQFLQCGHGKLGGDRTVLCPGKRNIFVHTFLADYHTRRVHGRMPRQSLQTFCHVDQIMDIVLLLIDLPKFRIHFQCLIYSDIQFLRNHFRNDIHLRIRHIQYTAHITDNTAGCQCTKCNDLHHAVLPVFPDHIVDDLLASFKAEIHVYIRHGHTLRIQEPLKQQIIPDGIKLCNSKGICHKASRRTSTPRPYHNSVFSGIVDKIPYDQEVIHISHVSDRRKLIIQTFFQFVCYRIIQALQTFEA